MSIEDGYAAELLTGSNGIALTHTSGPLEPRVSGEKNSHTEVEDAAKVAAEQTDRTGVDTIATIFARWTLHPVFFQWDTVKILISLSHNFPPYFDINVPTLVPPLGRQN